MFRRAIVLLFAFSFIVVLSAPAQEDGNQDNQPTPSDKLEMKWKLEKGKDFFQKMTTDTTQKMTVMGMDVSQSQNQTFYFKWSPLEETDGKWKIKQTIEGVKMTIDIAGNPISFDSTSSSSSNSALADFFNALKGTEFTLTFNDKMQVEAVEGREALVTKLTQANRQLENLLKAILSEEALKKMADPTFGMAPPEPKAVGETWTATTTLDLGPIGTYENTYTYTYKGKDAEKTNLDRIEVTVAISYKAPTGNAEGLPFQINSADLKNTNTEPGVILWDAEKGWVESSTIKIVLDGTLDLTIGGMKTKVDLKQEQTTKVETADGSYLPKGT